MIKSLFTLRICAFLMLLGMGLSSCQQEAPDLSKKERDARLIGTWTIIETAGRETLPGEGAKVSNWTYDDYYQIEGEKLYLWMSEEDMNARKYESAVTYIRKPNS